MAIGEDEDEDEGEGEDEDEDEDEGEDEERGKAPGDRQEEVGERDNNQANPTPGGARPREV